MKNALYRLLTVQSQDEETQQRGQMVIIIGLAIGLTCLFLLPVTFFGNSSRFGAILLTCSMIGLFISIWLARIGQVTLSTWLQIGIVIAGTISADLASQQVSFGAFFLGIAPLIASLIMRPREIWIVLIINIILLLIVGWNSSPNAPLLANNTWLSLSGALIFQGVISSLGFLGASHIQRTLQRVYAARNLAQQNAAELARTNEELEARIQERTLALQTAFAEVQERAEAQARLIAENEQQRQMILQMSVPIIPVSDSVMVMPLVGSLDSQRLNHLTQHALHTIQESKTCYLVLDITGLVLVDTQVAQGIMKVVQSTRLLGAETLLVGIRPEVAQTVVQLGLRLDDIRTYSTLQAALTSLSDEVVKSKEHIIQQ